VHARYADGRVAPLDASYLDVDILATDRLTYELSGSRAQVGIAQNALRAGCYDQLLSVGLSTCSERFSAVEPPISLDGLPEPVGVQFAVSVVDIASSASFARSGALSVRPSEYGHVTIARVVMSDGSMLSLLQVFAIP
jgi:hypothetical protein